MSFLYRFYLRNLLKKQADKTAAIVCLILITRVHITSKIIVEHFYLILSSVIIPQKLGSRLVVATSQCLRVVAVSFIIPSSSRDGRTRQQAGICHASGDRHPAVAGHTKIFEEQEIEVPALGRTGKKDAR